MLTSRQVLRILAQPDVSTPLGLRDRALLEVLYSTGLRLGELRALTVAALDFQAGLVRIERGKGGKWRVVPIGRAALEWTTRYLDEVRPRLVRGYDDDTLFLSYQGRRMSDVTVGRLIVARYVAAARIPFSATTHAFRHAAATHLLRGDGRDRRATLLQVRDILGHASADTTKIYTRIEIADLAAELRARHFREGRRRRPRR